MEQKNITNLNIPQRKEDAMYPINEIFKTGKTDQQVTINCKCLQTETNIALIQCQLCLCWQHVTCSGFNQENHDPEKYICVICRNPSGKLDNSSDIDKQQWLYDGKLPVADYHAKNPALEERFNILKKTHVLMENLLELKKFLHGLEVKINIANTKNHPKLHLWENDWETNETNNYLDNHVKWIDQELKSEEKDTNNIILDDESKFPDNIETDAVIDSETCQLRLLKHIKNQQGCLKTFLDNIEAEILEIESLEPPKTSNSAKTQEILALMIKDLETMRNLGKLNIFPPPPRDF